MKIDDKKEMKIFIDNSGGICNWFGKVFYPHRLRARIFGEIALRMLFFIGKI